MAKIFIEVSIHMRNYTVKKPEKLIENKFTPLPALINKQGKNTDQTKGSILSIKGTPLVE